MRAAMEQGQIGATELSALAAEGATLDREYTRTSLARLAALRPGASEGVDEGAGRDQGAALSLNASCTFQAGSEGFPQVHLRVAGAVPLVCQRCMELLVLPVSIDVRLTVVGSDEEAAGLADPFEAVLLDDGNLLLAQVVEDEVLAILPLAPKHLANTPCGRSEGVSSGETHRPMAGLAELLGRGARRSD